MTQKAEVRGGVVVGAQRMPQKVGDFCHPSVNDDDQVRIVPGSEAPHQELRRTGETEALPRRGSRKVTATGSTPQKKVMQRQSPLLFHVGV